MKLLAALNAYPRLTATLGAISGWASFDWLRAAQFSAAALASLVSLCAFILIVPKAVAEVRRWVRRWRR